MPQIAKVHHRQPFRLQAEQQRLAAQLPLLLVVIRLYRPHRRAAAEVKIPRPVNHARIPRNRLDRVVVMVLMRHQHHIRRIRRHGIAARRIIRISDDAEAVVQLNDKFCVPHTADNHGFPVLSSAARQRYGSKRPGSGLCVRKRAAKSRCRVRQQRSSV